MDLLERTAIPDNLYEVFELEKYLHFGEIIEYDKNEHVKLPGELSNSLGYVVSGRVRCSIVAEDGSDTLLFYCSKAGLLGTLYTFTDDSTLIVTQEKTKLCFFTKEALEMIFANEPAMYFEILKNYTAKASYFMQRVASFENYGSYNRILRLLYNLCQEKGQMMPDGYHYVPLRISQKDISEITGVHFVTVSKTLKWLYQANIAEKKTTGFYIYDIERLEQLCKENFSIKDEKFLEKDDEE